MATLAIGMPVYNRAAYLERTLACLRDQEYADIEVLIADNASTDDTFEVAKAAAKEDPRIRVIQHAENMGAIPNFNYVFHHTTAPYFAWLASDDMFDPRFFARMVAMLDARPDAVCAMSQVQLIDGDDQPIDGVDENVRSDDPDPAVRFADFAGWGHFCQFTFGVTRRSAMLQTGLMPKFWTGDRLYCAELALTGPMLRDQERLYFIRQHLDRATRAMGRKDNSAVNAYLTPNGSRAFVLHYAKELRASIERAPITEAQKRDCRKALNVWALRNWSKLGRSTGRRVLEVMTRK
ncbi:glycosyltransferase involved in cell wall biosynthesis [Allocatelliglobosispora scoriae]|uniref:Glycosyltransferase involved in cell wall biosynthesis n=1 Tax=Allocatelliglobosispora scoriae TaxID=643052 RepID=A0A841BV63_9ACTN|nr:glycosyltransferase family 2 protein [Allocatelliglobosispora scoriae]MBB5872084.1 glycosyltransferase involved in cell wall biosynthesis [Allocatelliglobosispora scoriae]